MRFELQQRLWTEYIATTITLNSSIKDDRLKHPIMTFPEFIDDSEFHLYHSVPRYSFIEDKHYDFKGLSFEPFDDFYKRS